MRLFLQPNDTFFFRDGRPFTKGDQSEGYTIFPPLPSTILGALRTAYITEQGDLPSFYAGQMVDTIGTPCSLGSMQLKGVFLADKKFGIYFPIPLDLIIKKVVIKDEANKLYTLASWAEPPNFRSNALLTRHLRWGGSEDVEPETSGKLRHIYLKQYLLGRRKAFRCRPHEDFVCDEPKVGIERNRTTLTSEESMLYRINMSRFQSRFLNTSELGFFVDYCCDEQLPEKGLLKLGGEGKSFLYELSAHNPNPLPAKEDEEELKAAIHKSGSFKLYFATPAIFEHGWLPKWIDKKTQCGQYPVSGTGSMSIKLVTAAVGKSIPVGGWDMKKGESKPTRRAVPAGSIYYFKVSEESCVDTIINTFHYKNISDYQAEEGFGLCFVGVA